MLAGLKVPVSVTFANRTELIDETEVRGQVGFTVDLSKFQKALRRLRGGNRDMASTSCRTAFSTCSPSQEFQELLER